MQYTLVRQSEEDDAAADSKLSVKRIKHRERLAITAFLICACSAGVFFTLLRFKGTKSAVQVHNADALQNDTPYVVVPSNATNWVSIQQVDGFSPVLETRTDAVPVSTSEKLFRESGSCLEDWVGAGQLCAPLVQSPAVLEASAMSVLWTWSNGSDPYWAAAQQAYHGTRNSRHFRTHNELRYSLRSVLRNLPANLLRGFYLYTSDLPSTEGRKGLLPSWLSTSMSQQSILVQPIFPHQVFKSSASRLLAEVNQWRQDALPTFNSMAIESQFPSVELATDSWICNTGS